MCFVPHTELSSDAVSSPLCHPWSAAGSPWQRPCRNCCVERQKGDGWWQWDISTRRRSCEGQWPRVTQLRWGELRGRQQQLFPWLRFQQLQEQRTAKLGGPSSFLFTSQTSLLANPVTHSLSQLCSCKGWQLRQTQVHEYSFPCHLLDGNLPAASVGVWGGALQAKPLGWLLGASLRPLGTGRWSLRRHWQAAHRHQWKKTSSLRVYSRIWPTVSFWHGEGKVIRIPMDFVMHKQPF